MLPLAPLLLIAAAFLSNAVIATFVMCTTHSGLPAARFVTIPATVPKTADGCGSVCQGAGYLWSYYLSPSLCRCSDTSPSNSFVVDSTSDKVPVACGDNYVAHYVHTNYVFQGCYASAAFKTPTTSSTTDVANCFATCLQTKLFMMAISFGNGVHATCTCAPDGPGQWASFGKETVCGNGEVAYYELSHKGPSFTTKRSLQWEAAEVKRQERAGKVTSCPSGMVACEVAGTGSFECLDPMEELEACGGCVDGYFDPLANASAGGNATGTDCTKISGVAPGGVMCQLGGCKVSVCATGFRLVGGSCVPALRQQVRR